MLKSYKEELKQENNTRLLELKEKYGNRIFLISTWSMLEEVARHILAEYKPEETTKPDTSKLSQYTALLEQDLPHTIKMELEGTIKTVERRLEQWQTNELIRNHYNKGIPQPVELLWYMRDNGYIDFKITQLANTEISKSKK